MNAYYLHETFPSVQQDQVDPNTRNYLSSCVQIINKVVNLGISQIMENQWK